MPGTATRLLTPKRFLSFYSQPCPTLALAMPWFHGRKITAKSRDLQPYYRSKRYYTTYRLSLDASGVAEYEGRFKMT